MLAKFLRICHKKETAETVSFFDIKKNHAIVAWFGRGLPMSLEIKTPIVYNESMTRQSKSNTQSEDIKMSNSSNTTNSLAHTKWNCKYHIIFAPKYRRKVFYENHRAEIREILRKLCEWKGVEIIEGEICPDHVHILVSIPPKMRVSVFMGYLKGKSATIIFQKFGNMKFAYRNREFWCKGYYVDTVGKNTKAIQEYVANQLKADKDADQLSIFDPRDPLTGSK